MHRILKILHLIGLAMFLGSVFGHIVSSALGGPPGSPGFLAARHEVVVATRALTLPGLGLLLVTGIAMAALSPGLRRQRWLWLHAGLAVIVLATSAALVVPAGTQALAAAQTLVAGGATAQEIESALRIETFAGAFNILLAVAALAIGVIKPSLRPRAGT